MRQLLTLAHWLKSLHQKQEDNCIKGFTKQYANINGRMHGHQHHQHQYIPPKQTLQSILQP
eukprot:10079567-Ditylum_brightwellii.AAC.1